MKEEDLDRKRLLSGDIFPHGRGEEEGPRSKMERGKRITGEELTTSAIDGIMDHRLGHPLDAHPVVFLAKQSSRVCASDVKRTDGEEDGIRMDEKRRARLRRLESFSRDNIVIARGSIEEQLFFAVFSPIGRRGNA